MPKLTNEELIERFRQRMANQGKEGVGPCPLSVGLKVWYQKLGQPETGPCTILLIHGQWNVVQKTNGEWAWIPHGLLTRTQPAE